jgi:hypothetical protein
MRYALSSYICPRGKNLCEADTCLERNIVISPGIPLQGGCNVNRRKRTEARETCLSTERGRVVVNNSAS